MGRAVDGGRSFDAEDLVFTSDPLGQQPWRPELVTRRWERLWAKAGLENVKIHGLRHVVATELLTAGIDLRTVANRLGHARTSTTLDIYWAWVPAQDQAAADPPRRCSQALEHPLIVTAVYHFTHIDHLAGIIADGLVCDTEVAGALTQEVGNHGIKASRRRIPVKAGPGGVVADYVPFYFAPRCPMM